MPPKKIRPKTRPEVVRHRSDEDHRAHERANWDVQNNIAESSNCIAAIGASFSILAAISAIVAAFFAGGAYFESKIEAGAAIAGNRISQTALVAANRAWLSIKFTSHGDIYYDSQNLNFPIGIEVQNRGNSPVNGVLTDIGFIMGDVDPSQLRNKCSGGRKRTDLGAILFPDEVKAEPGWTIAMPRKEVAAATQAYAAQIHQPEFGSETIGPISIYACVDYVLPADGTRHQTGIVRPLTVINPASPGFPQLLPQMGIGVPSANLVFFTALTLNDYAN